MASQNLRYDDSFRKGVIHRADEAVAAKKAEREAAEQQDVIRAAFEIAKWRKRYDSLLGQFIWACSLAAGEAVVIFWLVVR